VSERGPYVYRELVHRKVDVRFVGTTTEFRVWRQQQFDHDLTTAECGPHCSEHDQVQNAKCKIGLLTAPTVKKFECQKLKKASAAILKTV